MKKLKFILPTLAFIPLVPMASLVTSCGAKEDTGIPATKVTITNHYDQEEFDIQDSANKRLALEAKVEPAEADQEVTYEILDQEGTGNIACSSTGVVYHNSSVGTITVRAWSKDKKVCSDPVELVFWNSQSIKFYDIESSSSGDLCYVSCEDDYIKSIEDVVIPSKHIGVDSKGQPKEYKVNGIIYGGFNGAMKLSYARLPKTSEDFVYMGSYSFYQCISLKKLVIPDATQMIDTGAFYGCNALSEIYLAKKLKYINSDAFSGCVNLTNIDLLNTELEYIGASAFYQCNRIEKFDLPLTIRIIGEGAFANCWLSTIYINGDINGKNDYFQVDEKGLYNNTKTRLLTSQYSYSAPDGKYTIDDSIEKIDSYAFLYCDDLTSIYFSDNSKCTSIGEGCFSLCTRLTHVSLPKNLTEIKAKLFEWCWNLNSVKMPINVALIQKNAFYGCENLQQVAFDEDPEHTRTLVENTWVVYNDGLDPKMAVNIVNVKDYELRYQSLLAKKFISYGSYIDPDHPQYGWDGGYSNCVWLRSDTYPFGDTTIGIEVGTKPTKTSYNVGDPLDLTGLKINSIANNGTIAEAPSSSYTTEPANGTILTADNNKVTVTYTYAYEEDKHLKFTFETEFEITVTQ